MDEFTPIARNVVRERNDLADKFQDEINYSLRGYVLPSRKGGFNQFSSDEIPMYEARREWRDIDTTYQSTKNYGYEMLVNDFFWNLNNKYEINKKVLVLLGERGIGKSTFIQHYLRCYCPEKKPNQHSFEKKLVVYFDAKPCTSNELFGAFFLETINEQLKKLSIDAVNDGSGTILTIFESLRRLSDYSKRAGKHMVLCLDNIDQCSFEIQTHASSLVHRMVEDSEEINIWKIIFPCWPETFHKLKVKEKFNIRGKKYREINLGYVNSRRMIFRRLSSLNNYLSAKEDKKAKKYFSRIRSRSYDTLHNLSYRDNKLVLKMVADILSSKGFYEYQDNTPKKDSLRKYEFEDVLICGQYNYHHSHNVVLNFFNILRKNRTKKSSDILLGIVFLYELGSSGECVDKSDFVRKVSAYGFDNGDIEEVISTLKLSNLIHYGNVLETEIVIHEESINEYLQLILSPAYIDNMAIVTPTAKAFHKKMSETKGYKKGDFKARVITSIEFIKFLHLCEAELNEASNGLYKYQVWEKIVKTYYLRLRTLRNDSRYLKKVATKNDTWWDRVFADDVFSKLSNK